MRVHKMALKEGDLLLSSVIRPLKKMLQLEEVEHYHPYQS